MIVAMLSFIPRITHQSLPVTTVHITAASSRRRTLSAATNSAGLFAGVVLDAPSADRGAADASRGVASSPVLSRDGMAIAFSAVAEGCQSTVWVGCSVDRGPAAADDGGRRVRPRIFRRPKYLLYFDAPKGYRVPSSGRRCQLVIRNASSANLARGTIFTVGQPLSAPSCRRSPGSGARCHRNSYAALSPVARASWSPKLSREPSRNGGSYRPRERAAQTSLGADCVARASLHRYECMACGRLDRFHRSSSETQTLWKVRLVPTAGLDKAVAPLAMRRATWRSFPEPSDVDAARRGGEPQSAARGASRGARNRKRRSLLTFSKRDRKRKKPSRRLLLRAGARRLPLCVWRGNQGAAQGVPEIVEMVVVLVLDPVRELRDAAPILARRK